MWTENKTHSKRNMMKPHFCLVVDPFYQPALPRKEVTVFQTLLNGRGIRNSFINDFISLLHEADFYCSGNEFILYNLIISTL
jgi:hypothetical protein